ncbi:peptidase domain-containing ABC transporter [Cohaesibacter celericrescens]|uniref:Lantibiotic ABC transporter n=1 Tax=Cohaesibacter celericrescens TaxID=2067669 RepID=A0A2N5XUS0_9HYPH|nr:ABC transporter transmembrane domain-containing protein [Cohaesibacter celericrescens]PLW78168.1 hypothetical protein C0081_05855 [Cohaesibacter celericrescens]
MNDKTHEKSAPTDRSMPFDGKSTAGPKMTVAPIGKAPTKQKMALPRMFQGDMPRPQRGEISPNARLSDVAQQVKHGEVSLQGLANYSAEKEFASLPVDKGIMSAEASVQETLPIAPAVEIGLQAEPVEPDVAVPYNEYSDYETLLGINERWNGIDYGSSAGRCLQVLLPLMGWGGDGRHLAQVLPHFNTVNDLTGLKAVLTRLNFVAVADQVRLSSLSQEKLPCLFEDKTGIVHILLSVNHGEGTINSFCGATGEEKTLNCLDRTETIYLIKPVDIASQKRFVQSFGWVTHAAASFRRLFLSLFVINFGINLAAMAVPIFIMSVYGYAIPSKAPASLGMFVVGIGLIITADYALRHLRTRILAYIGARFDTALSVEVFQRLLYMPYAMMQNASMGSQLSRLRQFEKLREIFLGSFGTAVLDLPFVFVFIIAIAIIGGWIAVIPAVLLVAYTILAIVTVPIAKRQTMQSGDAKSQKQNVMMELFLMHREIRNVGGGEIWQQRYEQSAASFAALDFRAQHFSQKIQIVSQAFSMAAGLCTLGVGTMMVMAGDLGVGGLIAIMALIWRVLSPLQNAFLSLSRVGKLIEAIRMVNNLMRMQPERTPGVIPSISRNFAGHITTKNLSFRYPQASDAAIKSANVTIKPGEIVAITGPSGGGKSTFLKLLAGLYRPVAGAVGFDHLDIRQIDMGELRFEISYQPDHPTFFYGTVEQNFHLNDPKADHKEILRLMEHFDINQAHPNLPEGLQTRLKTELVHQMPDSFKQKLLLCRSFSKSATYYFLDEPANYLDFDADRKFMQLLAEKRGKSTILFTTQRPSHMKDADRVIVLHEGQIILNGPPEQVLPQLDAFNKSVA